MQGSNVEGESAAARIDITENEAIDEEAFDTLVRTAAAHNRS